MIYGLLAPIRQRFPKTAGFIRRVPLPWLVSIYIAVWFGVGFVGILLGVKP